MASVILAYQLHLFLLTTLTLAYLALAFCPLAEAVPLKKSSPQKLMGPLRPHIIIINQIVLSRFT